jgi:hypothetical protein
MTVHAFADESRRGSTYLIAVAIADPGYLRPLRRELRGLLLPGQRELHFNDQKDRRRRVLSDAIARLPVEARVYRRTCDNHGEPARQHCIDRIVCDLLSLGAQRLVLDSRSQLDSKDEVTIRSAIVRHPHHTRFTYEHVDSASESLLWVADAVAWCFGAGGHWRKRVDRIIGTIVDLG